MVNWQALYYYFNQWKQDGTFERINAASNQLDRKRVDREAYPSALCVDAQSVKPNPMISEYRGMDVNKRVNGRKREFIVDTDGRFWVVDVYAANEAEGPATLPLISTILWRVGNGWRKSMAIRLITGYLPKRWLSGALILRKLHVPNRPVVLYL